MSEEAKQTDGSSRDVLLAFRLGWTLSEFMGRARSVYGERKSGKQGKQSPDELQGFEDDESPRFAFSNRYFSDEGAWWQSATRMVALADKLGLLPEKDKTAERIRELPGRIYALTFDEEAPGDFPSPREFYTLLEPWSRHVGNSLAAQSDEVALAFMVGGEIADTYWFMRGEEHYGEPRDWGKHDSWHQLLNYKRLIVIIERIKRFEDELPPLLGHYLRYTLYRWGISHDLEYEGERMVLIRDSIKKPAKVERESGGIRKQIEAEDEKTIAKNLREQTGIWHDLILGIKTPADYLNKSRRRIAFGSAVVLYGLTVIAATAVLSLVGYLFIIYLGGLLSSGAAQVSSALYPVTIQSDKLKTSLDIVATSIPLITSATVFIVGVMRVAWEGATWLWSRLHGWILRREIEQRIWVRWNR